MVGKPNREQKRNQMTRLALSVRPDPFPEPCVVNSPCTLFGHLSSFAAFASSLLLNKRTAQRRREDAKRTSENGNSPQSGLSQKRTTMLIATDQNTLCARGVRLVPAAHC